MYNQRCDDCLEDMVREKAIRRCNNFLPGSKKNQCGHIRISNDLPISSKFKNRKLHAMTTTIMIKPPTSAAKYHQGLNENISDNDLLKHFSKFGTIVRVEQMRWKDSNKKRGYGFVEYKKQSSVQKAVNAGNHVIKKRILEARACLPKKCEESVGRVRTSFATQHELLSSKQLQRDIHPKAATNAVFETPYVKKTALANKGLDEENQTPRCRGMTRNKVILDPRTNSDENDKDETNVPEELGYIQMSASSSINEIVNNIKERNPSLSKNQIEIESDIRLIKENSSGGLGPCYPKTNNIANGEYSYKDFKFLALMDDLSRRNDHIELSMTNILNNTNTLIKKMLTPSSTSLAVENKSNAFVPGNQTLMALEHANANVSGCNTEQWKDSNSMLNTAQPTDVQGQNENDMGWDACYNSYLIEKPDVFLTQH